MLSKQREGDPWQEMDASDVSVVSDDGGFTYLRAHVNHFTWFGSARRTSSASENLVDFHWQKSVLVVNKTSSVAHVTPMPISFQTGMEATKAVALTFCEASLSFETGKKTDHLMLPVNRTSEIIPVGGSTPLFLSGGGDKMQIIVCFLPDRDKSAMPSSPTQASQPTEETPTMATSALQDPNTQASTTAAPSSGALPPLGLLSWMKPLVSGPLPQSDAEQKPPIESEDMVYSMTKVMPGRRRLTLRHESVNRKIKIEKNARALETYAMMLADFGTSLS